ncbi:MAG: Phosphate transporter family protein [Candidatus Methanolliviera sp. GoM_asphalt]|nr:MAG: Phosphate transporter family protein [Candidatus Methanolliviera sp. GoM_asphalt]
MVDLWHLVLIVTSVFYSILIGANASYAMAASFGSRAMSKVKILFLLSISLFLGAMTASENVVETIAGGVCLIPGDVTVAYVILVSALFCVLMANIFKIPLYRPARSRLEQSWAPAYISVPLFRRICFLSSFHG